MILIVVSVRDAAAEAFARPIFVPAVGIALRSFQEEVNRADAANPLYAHPEDFDLYKIAEFDDSRGVFNPLEVPELLLRGKSAKVPVQ